MDRATIRNIFFPNNGAPADAGQQQPSSGGDTDAAARALEIAGYPTLLQEYLWQQQQQQQQERVTAVANAAAIESRLSMAQGMGDQWGDPRLSSGNLMRAASQGAGSFASMFGVSPSLGGLGHAHALLWLQVGMGDQCVSARGSTRQLGTPNYSAHEGPPQGNRQGNRITL